MFSVEDTTDLQVQASSNKKKMLEKNFTKESEKWLNRGYYISLDPLRDGSCRFSFICRILREFCFQPSPDALRAEIVSYLETNPNDSHDTPLDFFMDGCSIQQLLKLSENIWDFW